MKLIRKKDKICWIIGCKSVASGLFFGKQLCNKHFTQLKEVLRSMNRMQLHPRSHSPVGFTKRV